MKYIALFFLIFPYVTVAHETASTHHQAELFVQGAYRYIHANGIPDHQTGGFPNRNNPNAIREQSYRYRVPKNPRLNDYIAEVRGQPFGVALNGIPFDPGTAECWGQHRGGHPAGNCDWREEAIVNGEGKLGLDSSNAHVQPNGAYHYHGIPTKLVSALGGGDLVHVGYAADGFKIYVDQAGAYPSSYILKTGRRLGGPGGKYDGTYTADFEYVIDAGILDECNGTSIGGEYAYVLTDTFPFIPRCWRGTPDDSLTHGGLGMRNGLGTPDGRRPPHHRRPIGL